MKGLVIGKLYPLHAGHEHLIRTALEACDSVLVIVCWKNDESPSGNLRAEWVKELYPTVQVETIYDTYDPNDSELWANLVKKIANDIDVVYTSEVYGDPFAKYLNCQHVCVDIKRKTFPISGTEIRNDPKANWKFLSIPVRHFYMQRYVIVGSESTWKSTISKHIAQKLDYPLVVEYGREYCENKKSADWTEQDFHNIRKGQLELERQFTDHYRVICDTDTATTLVWAKRYLGYDIQYPVQPPTLYLISELKDSSFVQDGTRDDIETGQRERMEPEIVEMVKRSGSPFVFLTGTLENRIEQALQAVNAGRQEKYWSVLTDIKSFTVFERLWVFLFGFASIIFSFFDLRTVQWWSPEQSTTWQSFIFLTSGIASFSGVLCVVLVAKRKFSNFFWGVINCVMYGLFSISFGYVGNFQLNILFFLPLQFLGVLQWKGHLTSTTVVKNKKLTLKYWLFTLLFGGLLCLALFYEIRELAVALTGSYVFDDYPLARSLDAITTSLSVCAQILLSFRYSEQWYFWIVINILQIAMFSLPETLNINILIMWILFLLNSFYGLRMWLKS